MKEELWVIWSILLSSQIQSQAYTKALIFVLWLWYEIWLISGYIDQILFSWYVIVESHSWPRHYKFKWENMITVTNTPKCLFNIHSFFFTPILFGCPYASLKMFIYSYCLVNRDITSLANCIWIDIYKVELPGLNFP